MVAVDSTVYGRHQVTMFVPGPVGSVLDELRQRWDAVMAGRIHAHVTVLRRVARPDVTITALRDNDGLRACRARLGPVRRAEPAHGGGVFVEVLDPFGDLARLRSALADFVADDPEAVQLHPHVTLAHPRTVPPGRLGTAWEELRQERLDADFVLDRLTLIGETEDGWSAVSSVELAGS
jgi:hypothetical protein